MRMRSQSRSESGNSELNKRGHMDQKEKEIAIQLITLMAHIEGMSAEQQFVPPVAVNATDQDGNEWDFEYSPEWDCVDLLQVAPTLPVTLRLKDANGKFVETQITELTLRPDWIKRLLQ
jgi:hypothetical protein